MNNPNNPPAFPVSETYTNRDGDVTSETKEGMSLRDYFAAKAMQGFASKENEIWPERFANNAYRVADAMLAEREKLSNKD